jgi:hypothetical protein
MNDTWMQLITVILTNFSVIWWFRKESREDWKMIHQEMKEFKEAIRLETKEFHERLLEIERGRK